MEISRAQREALSSLYAYGCEGEIRDGCIVSLVGTPILGSLATWLEISTLGLAAADGRMRIRLTAAGEAEARKPVGSLVQEVTTRSDGTIRVRTGRVRTAADATRRKEWWWITSKAWKVTEPVPELVSYFEDTPCLVEAAGAAEAFSADDCRLVERILPAGMAGSIAEGLRECIGSWDWDGTVERCAVMLGTMVVAGVRIPDAENA